MQIIAEKRVLEFSESNIETVKTVFSVEQGETVEALLLRVGMDGRSKWHYDQMEVRLKLVTPNAEGERRASRTLHPLVGTEET